MAYSGNFFNYGNGGDGIRVQFKKLADTWRCPFCGVDKTMFKKYS
ncbi:MAG: rubredoxin [Deltaproteobacteria bacterium]|nr:rubredoxin [Deltaproteobacteria bacterium]